MVVKWCLKRNMVWKIEMSSKECTNIFVWRIIKRLNYWWGWKLNRNKHKAWHSIISSKSIKNRRHERRCEGKCTSNQAWPRQKDLRLFWRRHNKVHISSKTGQSGNQLNRFPIINFLQVNSFTGRIQSASIPLIESKISYIQIRE